MLDVHRMTLGVVMTPLSQRSSTVRHVFVLFKEVGGESKGGAVDNAKRAISKLFTSSSRAVSRSHHRDFIYEVPVGYAVTCVTIGSSVERLSI